MAKSHKPEKPKTGAAAYPSPYGSHSCMINEEATAALNNPLRVVCTDEDGDYETDRDRIDNNTADANRHSGSRIRKKVVIQKEK